MTTVAELFATLGIKADKRQFAAADRLLSGVKKAIVGIVAFQSVKWAKGIVDGVIQTADRLDELSQMAGVNVESMQRLGHAASFSGISVESVSGALGKFSKAADSAASGSKDARKAFKEVGIDAKDIIDGTLSLDDAMLQIADKFKAMPDGAKKSALSMRLFSRSGRELIPVFNEGSEGLRKMFEDANQLGIVLDQKTIKEMAKFDDQQTKLSASMRGVKFAIIKELLPSMQGLLDRLMKWIAANRELIKTKVINFVKTAAKVVMAAGKAFMFLFDVVSKIVTVIVDLVESSGEFRAALVGAAVVIGAAWAASLSPLLLVAAAILGIALLVKDVYAAFAGGSSIIKDEWGDAIDFVGKKWDGFLSKFGHGGKLVTPDVKDKARRSSALLGVEPTIDPDKRNIMRQASHAKAMQDFKRDQGHARAGFGIGGFDPSIGVDPATIAQMKKLDLQTRTVKLKAQAALEESGEIAPRGSKREALNLAFNPTVTINGAGGTPEENAAKVRKALAEFWEEKVRELSGTTPEFQ